jgi:hypothetical protein
MTMAAIAFLHPAAFIEVGTIHGSLTKFGSKKWSTLTSVHLATYKRMLLIFSTVPMSKSHNCLAAVLQLSHSGAVKIVQRLEVPQPSFGDTMPVPTVT